jgi:succinoglycan biosynthesis protein ExoM
MAAVETTALSRVHQHPISAALSDGDQPGRDQQPGVASTASGPTVLVAIATYQRPEGLARVLDGIARLANDAEWRLEALVVDNAPDASARALVAERMETFPFPLHYVHETARGISHARNRALAEARALEKTYLAFLDDDEEPSAGWLAAMMSVAQRHGAAAVVGPVEARFELEPSAWVRQGRFHDIPGGENGAPIQQNTAGNSMLRLAAVDRLGLRFDPAFGLTGGEDTMFFTELRRGGEQTFFAKDALVREDISPRRAGLGWLMTRWYRTGITPVAVAAAQGGGASARINAALGGAVRMVLGALGAILASPLAMVGRAAPFHALRTACRGAGMIAGAMNIRFEEYRADRK